MSPPKVNTPANVNKLLKTRIIQGNNTPGALVSKVENLDPNKKGSTPTKHSERPLKCLETLAQKAGITFDEKYDNQANLEKSQSPAQVANVQQHLPLQLTQEHFNQLQQQFQLQQAFGQGATIHVKQEYPNQAGNAQNMTAEMKSQLVDANQQLQLQQMQILDQSAPQSPHQSNQNAQNAAMATLQQQVQAGQVPAEWQHGRVQVLQQPIQNSYMQQMYSPLLMSNGNILHGGIGQQQIQLISAPKPFQGNQLTPQMLTTQGKPVIGGPQSNFGGYTLPNSIASSQAQTLLFSPVGLVNQQGQQQQNILQQQGTPTKTTQDGQKQMTVQKVMQKVGNSNQTNTAVSAANQQQQTNQQCVQVSQAMPTAQLLSPLHQNNGQAMQFAPWQIQGMGPFFTTNQFQPQTLLASNQIFIRGTNPDGTPGMFLQQSPQQTQTVQQSPQHRKFI